MYKWKQKLELIKYNKSLQETLNINLFNYKFFSRRYIEYELNGKGKEFNFDGDLLFEGEYLNAKRNGKGKEYGYNGYFLFVGEFLNGKRNGKGNEYYYDGNLKFEGDFLNNNKYNGKGYDEYGNMI